MPDFFCGRPLATVGSLVVATLVMSGCASTPRTPEPVYTDFPDAPSHKFAPLTSGADAANLFSLQKYGNIYSRLSNPTVAALEERIASLEGGIGAVATASGIAAEFITFAALCQAGDHIVASSQLYGGTITQLDVSLRRFGIETTFVPGTDPDAFKAALRLETKAVYTEIVANPSGEIADLRGLADVAHEAGIPLVVDATLLTPPTWYVLLNTALTLLFTR